MTPGLAENSSPSRTVFSPDRSVGNTIERRSWNFDHSWICTKPTCFRLLLSWHGSERDFYDFLSSLLPLFLSKKISTYSFCSINFFFRKRCDVIYIRTRTKNIHPSSFEINVTFVLYHNRTCIQLIQNVAWMRNPIETNGQIKLKIIRRE